MSEATIVVGGGVERDYSLPGCPRKEVVPEPVATAPEPARDNDPPILRWFCNMAPGALRFELSGAVHGKAAESACDAFLTGRERLIEESFAPVREAMLASETGVRLRGLRSQAEKINEMIAAEQGKAVEGRREAERLLFAGKNPLIPQKSADSHDAEVARLEKWRIDLLTEAERCEAGLRRDLESQLSMTLDMLKATQWARFQELARETINHVAAIAAEMEIARHVQCLAIQTVTSQYGLI